MSSVFRAGPSPELLSYLEMLIESSQRKHKVPILKFEQLEGSANWLRTNFPSAVHVGLQRDDEYQLLSWLNQAAAGNYHFFESAFEIIKKNQSYFGISPNSPLKFKRDFESLLSIFTLFKNQINIVFESEMDFLLRVAPESGEDVQDQLKLCMKYDPEQLEIWRECLVALSKQRTNLPTNANRQIIYHREFFERMAERDQVIVERDAKIKANHAVIDKLNIEIAERDQVIVERNVERDSAIAARDSAIAARDSAIAARDFIISSKIWRTTSFYRKMRNFPREQ